MKKRDQYDTIASQIQAAPAAAAGTTQKKHFYLISGAVVVNVKDHGPQRYEAHCTIFTNRNIVTGKNLSQGQQSLIVSAAKKLEAGGHEYEVLDVTITGVSYLGHMTEATFLEGQGGLADA